MKERSSAQISGFVTFLPEERRVAFTPLQRERSLLDLAIRSRISIGHSCGGGGSCGTCRVFVRSGLEQLEPRNDVEQAMADDRGFSEDERLACQISPVPELVVEVPFTEPLEPESDW